MNANPEVNVVVFAVEQGGRRRELVGDAPTRAPDCVQRVWRAVAGPNGARAADVRHIYSEWEPSPEDKAFIEANFPGADVSYSFNRPAPDGWDQAMREVAQTIQGALQEKAAGGARPARKWLQFWK